MGCFLKIHFFVSTLNKLIYCCFVIFFLRRLGVELGKVQVYQEANRGKLI